MMKDWKLTPADEGVDSQFDFVGRKRFHHQHVEVETCNKHRIMDHRQAFLPVLSSYGEKKSLNMVFH